MDIREAYPDYQIIDSALLILAAKHQPGCKIESPLQTKKYLQLKLADYRSEVFGCLFLDNRHRIIALRELFQGTIDGASVYPRVVVQQALELNAAAVIFFHNHPSSIAEPSNSDKTTTKRLKKALALIDVHIIDHLIVSGTETTSFAESGLI